MNKIIVFVFYFMSMDVFADPMTPSVKNELTKILARLENSGCQFKRNQSWYTGVEAKSHLQRKFDYVENKTSAKTAEEFIDLAASKSSITGDPYQVKCAGQNSVPSSVWLLKQLDEIRKSNSK